MVVKLPNLGGVIPQSKDVFLDIFSIFIDTDQPLVYKTTVCRHTKVSFYFYSTCEKWHLWHFTDHLIKIVGTLFIYDRRYIHTWRDTEAANQSCSAKKVILRNFAKFAGKYLWWGPFEWISRVTDRKDSDTGISLWILRKFSEQFFCRTTLGEYFSPRHVYRWTTDIVLLKISRNYKKSKCGEVFSLKFVQQQPATI